MSARSATPGPRSLPGHRRGLRFIAVALGLAGALAFGGSGIAAAAPGALVWPLLDHSGFPSVARLANGSLLLVFRQGSDHYAARDGYIRSRRSTDLGATWSAPVA